MFSEGKNKILSERFSAVWGVVKRADKRGYNKKKKRGKGKKMKR